MRNNTYWQVESMDVGHTFEAVALDNVPIEYYLDELGRIVDENDLVVGVDIDMEYYILKGKIYTVTVKERFPGGAQLLIKSEQVNGLQMFQDLFADFFKIVKQ